MRSLYLKVLVWSIATVVAAMAGLFLHAALTSPRRGGPPFQSGRILADFAQRSYTAEGVEGLRTFMKYVSADTDAEIHVTDSIGKDLLTGDDRSALLREHRPERPRYFWPFFPPPPRLVFTTASTDGTLRWIIVLKPAANANATPSDAFIWILAAVAILAYLFTFYLVSPLRKLAAVVERFGSGDLAARARSQRRDELGNLARAFDQMAERIGKLVTTERRLLQDISHELRTPLARMRFAVEVARTDPNRRGALDRIKKECDRLALLTHELLEVSVAEGDPGGRHLERSDLSELLAEITADASIEAADRNVRLSLRTPPEVRLDMDRELLRRAVDNVLRNAIRYSPDGESIDVTLVSGPAEVNVSIRDRGPGVPVDVLDQIFDPFFRVDTHRARNRDSGGVGLGLAIAQRAVQRHHGAMKAENAEPGLRVFLTFPNRN
ncbi:MAG: HAMP domain-containing protein [Acidobacteria bacterium]|nr:HAMP domain-containing protein [Acidobacteriota bacterium]